MASPPANLRVALQLTDDQFNAAMAKAESRTRSTAANMNRSWSTVDRQVGGLTRSLGTFAKSFGIAFGVGAVGLALTRGIGRVVSATIEQEKAVRAVTAAIESTGGAAGLTAKDIEEMAAAFQRTTTFGDEFVLNVARQLLAFRNITKDTFQDSLGIVLDFAAATGRDATQAVRTLGLAINDPVAGLGRLSQAGVALTSTQKELIKSLVESGDLIGAQRLLIEELRKSYGGAAVAARDTLGGALEGLKNAWGDLFEATDGTGELQAQVDRLTTLISSAEFKVGAARITELVFDLASTGGEAAAEIDRLATSTGRLIDQFNDSDLGRFSAKMRELRGEGFALLEQLEQLLLAQVGLEAKPAFARTGPAIRGGRPQPPPASLGGPFPPLPLMRPDDKAASIIKARADELAKAALAEAKARSAARQQIEDTIRGLEQEATLAGIVSGERERLATILALENTAREGNVALTEEQRRRALAAIETTKIQAQEEERLDAVRALQVELGDELEDARLRLRFSGEELAVRQRLLAIERELGREVAMQSEERVRALAKAQTMQAQKEEELERARQQTAQLESAARDLGFTFSSSFEDAVIAGESLRDVLQGLLQDIQRIILRKGFTEPLAGGIAGLIMSGFGGGGTSPGGGPAIDLTTVLGSTLGMGRQHGGPVTRGRTYLVGERGPELFRPPMSGDIIPNHELGSGGDALSVTQHVTIMTGVAQTVRAEMMSLLPRFRAEALAGVLDAKQRGGHFGRAFGG